MLDIKYIIYKYKKYIYIIEIIHIISYANIYILICLNT